MSFREKIELNKLIITILIVTSILTVLPFFFVSFFNHPSQDDFARIAIPNYFDYIWNWYNTHNGRYFNAIITLIPSIYSSNVYIIFPIIIFISLFYTSYKLFESSLGTKKKLGISIVFSFPFVLVLLTRVPDITQPFYWYASVTAYTFSFILYLVLLEYLGKIYINKKKSFLNFTLVFIIIFMIIGSHEMMMVLVCLTIGFTFLYQLIFYEAIKDIINNSILLLWVIVCSLFVVLAPGSHQRQSNYSGNRNIGESIPKAIIGALEFIQKYFLTELYFYIVLFLVIALFLTLIKKNRAITTWFGHNPLYWLGVSIFIICMLYFVPLYSMGDVSGIYSGRIPNLLFMSYFLIIITNSLNILFYYRDILTPILQFKGFNIIILSSLSLFISVLFIDKNNWQLVVDDLVQEKVQSYHKESISRHEFIENQKKPINVFISNFTQNPVSVYLSDITTDPKHWHNVYYREVFSSKPLSITLINSKGKHRNDPLMDKGIIWYQTLDDNLNVAFYDSQLILKTPINVDDYHHLFYLNATRENGEIDNYVVKWKHHDLITQVNNRY